MQQDDAPMALPLMAIRAARRAIQANPDDAYAYLALGEAYVRLSQQTRERAAMRRMLFLDRIRKVQAVTAFNNALLLNPDLAQAHARLADYYTELRYADLVLKHRKELLRLTRASGPHPGESDESYQRRLDDLQQNVSQLDDDVREMLNVFEVNATNLKIVPRAQQAQARGLGGRALEILKASDITAFGKIGLEMELELLLTTGGIREFRAWFDPEQHRPLLNEPSAPFACEWYIVYLAAASGNYDEADTYLAAMDPSPSFWAQTLPLIGQAFLEVNPVMPTLPATLQAARVRERLRRQEALWSVQQLYRADLTAMRGLLALERGDSEHATALFRQALAIADAVTAATPGARAEFSGRSITEACLEMLAP
jgi:tetratricopeptide (TPR) repeat protein